MNEELGYIYRVASADAQQLLVIIEDHVGSAGWTFGGAAQWDFDPRHGRENLRPIESFSNAASIDVKGDFGHAFSENAEVRWKRRDDGMYDVLILSEQPLTIDGTTQLCVPRLNIEQSSWQDGDWRIRRPDTASNQTDWRAWKHSVYRLSCAKWCSAVSAISGGGIMSFRDRERGPIEPPLPKPYEFVPLPQGHIPTEPPAGHHRYGAGRLTGTLTAAIIARSPVHVASGLLEQTRDRQYPIVKAHFRTNGAPAIPGTSLKGCIRSIFEAISRSAVQITRARELPRDYQPSRRIDQLDIAQRIFGALGYQGMVRFGDAVLEGSDTTIVPSVQLFRPRSESVDTYFDGREPRGRKFYMHGKLARGNLPLEACPIDSRFTFRMEFENLVAGELGLVLIALGLGEPRFLPKLGGAKPACLGTIEVIDVSLTALSTHDAYADFDTSPKVLEFEPLLEAAKPLVVDTQLSKLAEVLRWPNEDRSCPDRNY